MALLWLLVLLGLAGPAAGTWDTCRGTCGLRPSASDHSSAAGTSRVVGGTGVPSGAWPGIVSIQATWENGTWHMCAGVLLSSQWVLTVAHCFARAGHLLKDFSKWEVVMGASDLSQPGPEAAVRHIQRLLVHQHYVPATARNDIALVELERPVECSDYIQLGCVPDASLRVSELKSCYIAGWNFARGMILREAKVHLMDTELCNSSRWYAGAVHADNLCAGYPHGGIDTCQGDSGSPLVCKDNRADYYWLVGLNSWGRGCDRARHPGIYTSTQHFYNWILIQTALSPADVTGQAPEPNCAPSPKPEATVTSAGTPTREPEPEPVTEATPAPEPTPEPTPSPEPTPEPAPEPIPVPDTTPDPVPEATGEPTPEPTTEPTTVPEPTTVSVPEPTTVPVPEPTLMSGPTPAPELEPEPDIPLAPEEEPVPAPEPTPERFLLISVPYQSLVKFCNLLRDFLHFLKEQLG
ncbi:acrosin-like [Hirundo rustica]|uniref:acrosin-like n=1 Tax=Hirundo rustica TaxID=43150 RepID=UPI001A94689E|nr:acrosin-like [Hirundo rustica]